MMHRVRACCCLHRAAAVAAAATAAEMMTAGRRHPARCTGMDSLACVGRPPRAPFISRGHRIAEMFPAPKPRYDGWRGGIAATTAEKLEGTSRGVVA